MGTETLRARIVILNYNGQDLLPQCLPSIVEAARKAECPTGVTILDNLSTDDGLDYVRKNYPEVELWTSPANKLLCSYNDYLTVMQEPVAILLNNDIRVDKGFVDPLIERFRQDSKTFLVAPKVMSFDGAEIQAARSKAGMRWGMFWCDARYPGYDKEADQASETYSSGFGAFSRKIFLELGGYDERYLPGILEDVDLCHRARRAGYRLYYEPKSVVYHLGQVSFKRRFGAGEVAVLAYRNTFLFMWKNFREFAFWTAHLVFLPPRILFSLLRGNVAFVRGFWQALWFKGER
ncbi:MAG: glycosyltransferase [Candidatus Omnitrophica bacterium]|nr:glycosyltransferase [Candidatus Omnitrophota bacterium]